MTEQRDWFWPGWGSREGRSEEGFFRKGHCRASVEGIAQSFKVGVERAVLSEPGVGIAAPLWSLPSPLPQGPPPTPGLAEQSAGRCAAGAAGFGFPSSPCSRVRLAETDSPPHFYWAN